MNLNNIERKKILAGEMGKAICNLANIVEDWNDAQEEPDERGRGNGAIGLIIFEDGSGFIAEFQQWINNDPLGNGQVVDKFHNPEEAQDWFMDNISGRSLFDDFDHPDNHGFPTVADHINRMGEKIMKCVQCKSEIVAGDLVVEEIVNGETLPLYHKECVEPVEFMNAVRRREVNRVFVFQETFQQAVINDPDMTYEQKKYWLSRL